MFRAFADVQTPEMLKLPVPALEGGKAQVVACPMSDEQEKLQQELVARYERLRSQKVDPREDNALAITTDGRKLALDARMLAGGAADYPGSKINALVQNVVSIWRRTEATRGTQMIFCDMGVNPTPWGYSPYEEIIDKLIAAGIPKAQIAAVGEADSDARKQALFEKVRNGTVRVLLGSTTKMGTGTNVQKRLVALHHLDAPWKPAEVEQREGRILRQKNENEIVAIYRYVTEGSFDAYMWQALETKARFIAQVMTGDNAARRADDIGGQELSYAEVKAIASGNPAVLTLAQADAELQRLSVLKKNHDDEQYLARRNQRILPDTIKALQERLGSLTTDMAAMKAHADDEIVVGSRASGDPVAALGACPGRPAAVRHAGPPRRARHLQGVAVRHGPASAVAAGSVPGRGDHPAGQPFARTPGAACRAECPGAAGQGLRLRMRPAAARPQHRGDTVARLQGAGRPAVPARRLQGPARRDARPAQGRTVRGGAAGGSADHRRTGWSDQGTASQQ